MQIPMNDKAFILKGIAQQNECKLTKSKELMTINGKNC
jgi:hypothetical protein